MENEKITIEELVALYKREAEPTPSNYTLQTRFDDYVANYTPQNPEKGILDEEIRECAYNFIEYDI